MASDKSFNAFAKPIDGITKKTSVGGAITLLASTIAAILFLSQLFLYYGVDVRHSLDLAQSHPLSIVIPTNGGFSSSALHAARRSHRKGYKRNKKIQSSQVSEVISSLQTIEENRIDLFVHITFTKLHCKVVDYALNNARLSTGAFSKEHGLSKFVKRKPNEFDFAKATGKSTVGLSRQRNSSEYDAENSCTVRGTITVPRIGGDLSFFLSEETFHKTAQLVQMGYQLSDLDSQTGGHDVSHYIHAIYFGDHFPLASNPLEDNWVEVTHASGISMNQIAVKVIPTKYKRFGRRIKEMYQLSVSNYIVTPETLLTSNPLKLPGLSIHYDFEAMAVHHVESRENFFVFLSSLIGIVGGVFVTVRLISNMVVNTASIVKKID